MRTCCYSNALSLTGQSICRIVSTADDSNRLKFKNKYTIVVVDCINPLRMRCMPSSQTYIHSHTFSYRLIYPLLDLIHAHLLSRDKTDNYQDTRFTYKKVTSVTITAITILFLCAFSFNARALYCARARLIQCLLEEGGEEGVRE